MFGKPVNAHPGLNVNQIIPFFFYANVFAALFVYTVIIETEGQTIYRKPQHKVTKLISKFYFFLG